MIYSGTHQFVRSAVTHKISVYADGRISANVVQLIDQVSGDRFVRAVMHQHVITALMQGSGNTRTDTLCSARYNRHPGF